MRAEYDAYFKGSLERAPAWVQRILPEIPPHWRSDARFYLMANIANMVVGPYLTVTHGPGIGSTEPLEIDLRETPIWEMLLADVRDIATVSESIAKARDRDYVSATSVAQALGALATELRMTGFQIWGPGDGDDQTTLQEHGVTS